MAKLYLDGVKCDEIMMKVESVWLNRRLRACMTCGYILSGTAAVRRRCEKCEKVEPKET